MTKSQEKAIERIRQLVERDMTDKQEIKIWGINEGEYFVSLVIEYGYIGDEGTLSAIFCRCHAHLFIGKRGGITYLIYRNGKQVERRFKGYSILQAVCDQAKNER